MIDKLMLGYCEYIIFVHCEGYLLKFMTMQ